MASIYRQSQLFRAALIRRERRAAAELAASYSRIWRSLQRELDVLVARLATESTAGLILRETQLRMLLAQVEAAATRWTRIATTQITDAQRKEIVHGADDAVNLLRRAYTGAPPGLTLNFAQLPEGVIEAIVGNLGDGSPLRDLFESFGPNLSREINAVLVNSIGAGRSVRRIARELQTVTQQPLARTLLISRTEVLRAYRQGSIETYRANNDVVKGWTWISAASERTCITCWMLHGTVHSNEEEFSDHPNGRCTPVPLTKSWAELGIAGMPEQAAIPSGASQFVMLPAEQQRRILGDASYKAWKAGAVDLQDFVGVKQSAQWGETHYQRSLTEILGPDAQQFYGEAPPQQRAA